MDRADRIGLGLATAGHVLLFAALSTHFTAERSRSFDNPPMQVDLITESAIESTAPDPSVAPPAARLATDAGPIELATPSEAVAPPVTKPTFVARATASPVPKPSPIKAVPPAKPRPSPRSAVAPAKRATTPAKSARAESRDRGTVALPTGALDGIVAGLGKEANASRSKSPPAAKSASQVKKAISVSIKSEVEGPWNSCRVSGADIEQLETTVVFRLDKTGGLAGFDSVRTAGKTDSNSPQVARFEECAKRAVSLAEPFDLPVENYDYWKIYTLEFDKR